MDDDGMIEEVADRVVEQNTWSSDVVPLLVCTARREVWAPALVCTTQAHQLIS
jgi:hypothetical protein